ncbi:hypothetical protein C8Q80DRAFT_1272985 [Daedaleopsis nitida]|nr:hypothetical protein C8Q80DRAFT_1272985 [Daedaleopsis nitida]
MTLCTHPTFTRIASGIFYHHLRPLVVLLYFIGTAEAQDSGLVFSDHPSIVEECVGTYFAWTGGTSPFVVIIRSYNSPILDPSPEVILNRSVYWIPTLPAFSAAEIFLADAEGTYISADFTVYPNPTGDNSCTVVPSKDPGSIIPTLGWSFMTSAALKTGDSSLTLSTTAEGPTVVATVSLKRPHLSASLSPLIPSASAIPVETSYVTVVSDSTIEKLSPQETSMGMPPPSPSAQSPQNAGFKSLNVGAIAGVAVGFVIVFAVLGVVICHFVQKRRRRCAISASSDQWSMWRQSQHTIQAQETEDGYAEKGSGLDI